MHNEFEQIAQINDSLDERSSVNQPESAFHMKRHQAFMETFLNAKKPAYKVWQRHTLPCLKT